MSKKAEQKNEDIKKLVEQMKSMQDEINRIKGVSVNAQPEPKYRYGIRILKLDDGRTHIEFMGPPGQQVTLTLEDISGLARALDERIRFWYQQQFVSEANQMAQQITEQKKPEEGDDDAEKAQDD